MCQVGYYGGPEQIHSNKVGLPYSAAAAKHERRDGFATGLEESDDAGGFDRSVSAKCMTTAAANAGSGVQLSWVACRPADTLALLGGESCSISSLAGSSVVELGRTGRCGLHLVAVCCAKYAQDGSAVVSASTSSPAWMDD